jgi:TonB family protein
MKLRATPFITILLLFTSLCVSARAYIWVTPPTQIDAVSMSTVEIVVAEPPDETTPGEPVCNSAEAKFEIADAMRISSEKLREKAKSLLRPAYPPMARARHIEGQVIVEVLVAKAGEVICVRTLSGDPLLRETVLKAAKRWNFEPFQTNAEVSNVVSTLAVNFKLR